MVVTSELGGRKKNRVDPLRVCSVSTYGLIDPEWQFDCNLSGTAGIVFYTARLKVLSLGRAFCLS